MPITLGKHIVIRHIKAWWQCIRHKEKNKVFGNKTTKSFNKAKYKEITLLALRTVKNYEGDN